MQKEKNGIISGLLRGISPILSDKFYCLNCLHSFRTKNKLESHKKLCENKDFCNVAMPSVYTKILELIQYCTSDKASFIIYGDLESLMRKTDGCTNNPGN